MPTCFESGANTVANCFILLLAFSPQITAECEADKKRLCSDVKPGGGRTHKCLEEMKEKGKLSKACEQSDTFRPLPNSADGSTAVREVDTVVPSSTQNAADLDWQGIPGVTAECEADKKRLCSDVKPGGGRTHKCLEEMKEKGKLSKACEQSGTFRERWTR